MTKLFALDGNSMKLDGGAMFGNAPKVMWSKWCVPDEQNRMTMSCRSLLIQDENKNILCDAVGGAFFSPKLRDRYGVVESEHVLLRSLAKIGLSDSDIDFVILSHLHFDHCGGLLSAWNEREELRLLFPNARFLVSKTGWERALHPHFRDQASFPENVIQMMAASGRLEIINSDASALLGKKYRFILSNGHTPGLLSTELTTEEGKLIYVSDLIPGTPWLHLPITTSYDRFPEELVNEKQELLQYVCKNQVQLFYVHDNSTAVSRVAKDEKGRFCATDICPSFGRDEF